MVLASFLWEGLVALGTLVLAAFTGWLAWVTRRLARTTAQEVQSQTRPIIVPTKDEIELTGPDETDEWKNFEVTIRLGNIGAGPALAVSVRLGSGLGPNGPPFDGYRPPHYAVLRPNAEVDATVRYGLYGIIDWGTPEKPERQYTPRSIPPITITYADMAGRKWATIFDLRIFRWLAEGDTPHVGTITIRDAADLEPNYSGGVPALERAKWGRTRRWSWRLIRRDLFPTPGIDAPPLRERLAASWHGTQLMHRQTLSQRVQWGARAYKETLEKPVRQNIPAALTRVYKIARGWRYAFRAYWRIR